MVVHKLKDLTEDFVKDMSEVELRENLLAVKEKASKASEKLGAYESKKNNSTWDKDTFTKEELEARVKQEIEKKEFLAKNENLSEEDIKTIDDLKTDGLSYNEALLLAQTRDETFGNQANTNNSSIDWGDKGSQETGSKLTLAQYEALGQSERDTYEAKMTKEFWGFTLASPEWEDWWDFDHF